MPVFVLSFAAMVALVGSAIALGMDSRSASNLQLSADSAAVAGATAFINTASPKADDRLQEAERVAAAMAEENSDYALTLMNVAAVTEDAYGQHTRIDIEMTFEPVNAMAKIAGRSSSIEITRSAAAEATWGFPLCILGLNTSGTGLETSGNVTVKAENCVIWTNSSASTSMDLSGGRISTTGLCSAGQAPVSGGASVSPLPSEFCDAIPDPLADWVPPSPSTARDSGDFAFEANSQELRDAAAFASRIIERTAARTGASQNDTVAAANQVSAAMGFTDQSGNFSIGPARGMTLEELLQINGDFDNVDPELYRDDAYETSVTHTYTPGTYNGLDIFEGHVEFKPGIYHIVDAPLVVRRRATLTGNGVTIIFHGDDATMNVLDEARLTLTAPTDGVTAGFALAEDRYRRLSSTQPLRSRMTGSGHVEMIGTVYLPRQRLSITGDGAAEQASPLLQIVADSVEMSDNGALNIEFDTSETDVPVKIKPARTARLVN